MSFARPKPVSYLLRLGSPQSAASRALCSALLALAWTLALGCEGSLSGRAADEQDGKSDPSFGPADSVGAMAEEQCNSTADKLGVGRTKLRRFTHSQYRNTMRDLLGATGDPAELIAPDEKVGPFYSNAISPVTDLLVQQHAEAAQRLAEEAVSRRTTLTSCNLDIDPDGSCAASFVTDFGRRAHRRPLTDVEREEYLTLYRVGLESGVDRAFQLVVETLLQSPFVLYHVDVGPTGIPSRDLAPLTSFELASRMSYFLWDTMPDERLFDLAASDQLNSPAVLGAEIDRMLADPRATDAIPSFHLQLLKIEHLEQAAKDTALYPQFTSEVAAAMTRETSRFTDQVIRHGDGLLSTLLSADYSVLEEPLFGFYGVEKPANFTEGSLVSVASANRGGLLTQGAFLAAHAHPNQTSPVHRGMVVRKNLLCQTVPPPPPDVNATPPVVSPDATTRERFEAHLEDPICGGCHQLMDPIGVGFEHFDAIGAYRTHDGPDPVDAHGEITEAGPDVDGPFTGATELSQRLAESQLVRECIASQWFTFALGRVSTSEDACGMVDLHDAFEGTGGNVRELIKTIVLSRAFTSVRLEEAP